jgi:hypothetical protein
MSKLQVAGCRFSVAGCRFSVAGCRFSVAGCRLLVALWGENLITCNLQPATCNLEVGAPFATDTVGIRH